jgi:hypothetical protein
MENRSIAKMKNLAYRMCGFDVDERVIIAMMIVDEVFDEMGGDFDLRTASKLQERIFGKARHKPTKGKRIYKPSMLHS